MPAATGDEILRYAQDDRKEVESLDAAADRRGGRRWRGGAGGP